MSNATPLFPSVSQKREDKVIENKTTRNKSITSTEQDTDVEAAAFRIAQRFGVRTDTTVRIVDEYGTELSMRALQYVEEAMANGQSFASPVAFLTSVLRKGIIQAEVVAETADPSADWAHRRYHDQQADSEIDTAAKRLARRSGHKTVTCPCGQEFGV